MKPLIVANWKCNPATLGEAKALFDAVKNTGAVICPPFVYLSALRANGSSAFAKGFGGLVLGSQDCFWENAGAYTGEISPLMLKNMGVAYAILGHSERRKYQKETDQMIAKKLKAALATGLRPILCIDKISQIPKDVKSLPAGKQGIIIAYEPLFAIGTGKSCSINKARKMKNLIKKRLGHNIKVLYGGSVNSGNAKSYVKEAGFEGLLVGGASLKPKEFIDLVRSLHPRYLRSASGE